MYKTPRYSATRQLIRDTLYHQTPIYGDVAGTNIGGKAKPKRKKKLSAWNKFYAIYRHRHPEWSIKRIATEYKRHKKHKPKRKPKKKKKIKKGKGVIVGGQKSELIEYIEDVKARYPYISPKMAMDMGGVYSGGVKYRRRRKGGKLVAKGAKKNPWLQFIQYHKRMPKKYWKDLYEYEKPLYKGSKEKQEIKKLIMKIIPKRAVKTEIKKQLPKVTERQAKTMAEAVHEDIAQKLQEEEKALEGLPEAYGMEMGEGFFGAGGKKAKKSRWIMFLKHIKGKKIPKAYLTDVYHHIYLAEHAKTGRYPYIKQFPKLKMKPKKKPAKKKAKKKKKKGKIPKQLSKWHKHVKEVKEANPGMEYKEVLQEASRTYEKGGTLMMGPHHYYDFHHY